MKSRLLPASAALASFTAVASIAAALAPSEPALAASRPAAGLACAPSPGDAVVTVARVTDDLDLVLADGRTVHLAGLDLPRASAADPALPAKARQTLQSWLASGRTGPGSPGGTILLHALSPVADRWNRIPALVWAGKPAPAPPADAAEGAIADGPGPEDPAASAAEALLRAGLGRVAPDRSTHGCLVAWLSAEATARSSKLGLWADPRYAVLAADDTQGLAAQAGQMVLVEGILRVHESRGTRYVTLGRDRWGFTAVLARRDAERFGKAGLDLQDYVGTPVRLRGDIDTRFGLRMVLTDPDQVESLEPGSIPVAAPAATAPRRRPPRDGTVEAVDPEEPGDAPP